jgi:Ca2+-binding EF-hand superfamily protein
MISSIGSSGGWSSSYADQVRDKMFSAMDTSGDGSISSDEITQLLSNSGNSSSSANDLISALDSDGDEIGRAHV